MGIQAGSGFDVTQRFGRHELSGVRKRNVGAIPTLERTTPFSAEFSLKGG
jgi:hypothetical protein